MAEVLSVTHYIQDVIEKTEEKAATAEAKANNPQYQRPIDTLVIQPDPGRDVSRLSVDEVNAILDEKIQLIIKIRKLQYSSDVETVATFLAPIVDNFKKLEKAYTVSLQEYKKNITNGQQKYDNKVLLEIADKMIVASLFEVAIFRRRRFFRGQLKDLEQALFDVSSSENLDMGFDSRKYGLDLFSPNPDEILPNTYLASLSEWHNNLNPSRFFVLRSWRSYKQLTVLLASCKDFVDNYKDVIAKYLGPVFAYLSWVFFIPRMLKNICTMIYSFVGGSRAFAHLQFPPLERQYGWYRRFKLRVKAIGAEIANDLMWIVTGLINCFSLAGSLPIIGVYIMVAAQTYDLFVMMIRNYADRTTWNTLQSDVEQLKADKGLDDSNYFLDNLKARIEFDKRVLLFALFNFALLLMCITLMTPVFGSISPLIPLIAGIVTVIIAPCRGYYLYHFKAETKKRFDAPQIDATNRGFVTLQSTVFADQNNFSIQEISEYCQKHKLFGIYNEGLLQVKRDDNRGFRLYKYSKNSKPSFEEITGKDFQELGERVGPTGPRVKSIGVKLFDSYTENDSTGTNGRSKLLHSVASVFGATGG